MWFYMKIFKSGKIPDYIIYFNGIGYRIIRYYETLQGVVEHRKSYFNKENLHIFLDVITVLYDNLPPS